MFPAAYLMSNGGSLGWNSRPSALFWIALFKSALISSACEKQHWARNKHFNHSFSRLDTLIHDLGYLISHQDLYEVIFGVGDDRR